MGNLVLFIILIGIAATLRYNYDKKYVLPVIEQNSDLSTINKSVLLLFAIAIFCFILQQAKIGFIILVILIPFVLYLNLKSHWIAFRNNKNGRK